VRTERRVWLVIGAAALAADTLPAQMPPNIATKLIAIGRGGANGFLVRPEKRWGRPL
jgi:hypothetical protein